MLQKISVVLLLVCLTWVGLASAKDEMAAAEDAVSNVLWDYEDSFEYVLYSVSDSGYVEMTFASNTPDDLYVEIITKLNRHPDVDGLMAGKNGAVCDIWAN